MNTSLEGGEELDYISSAEAPSRNQNIHPVDETDFPALERIQFALVDLIVHYATIDSLDNRDKVFTIEQQLEVNKKVKAALMSFKETIDTAILDIREQRDARQ